MKKIIVSLMLILLLGMIIFVYDAYKSVTSTYQTVSSQVEIQQLKRQHLTAMYNAARERSLILLEMLSEEDPFILDEFTQKLAKEAQRFISARSQLMQLELNEQELSLLETQNSSTAENAPLQNKVAELLNNNQRDKALSLLFDQAIPAQNEILKKIAELINFDSIASKALVDELNQKMSQTGVRFGIMMTFFLLALFSLIIYIQKTSRNQEKLLRSNLAMQENVSKQMKLSRERLRQFNDALSIFTFMLQPDGTVELVNKTAANSIGKDPSKFIGDQLYHCDFWLPKDIPSLKKDIYNAASGKHVNRVLKIHLDDLGERVMRFILTPIRDLQGDISHIVAEAQDITEQQKNVQKITFQASHDWLTGLVNRYEFEHRLSLLVQRAEDKRLHYVFYLDLDQFKVVNDTCGHAAGDELLRQIPLIIAPLIRKSDVLARLGGDEFGLILEDSSYEVAEKFALSIIKVISEYQFGWEDKVFRVGVSIGIVEVNDRITSAENILKWTDSACYVAKDEGRNTFHLYTPSDEVMIQREQEMSWLFLIEQALQEDKFELFAQPIVPVNATSGSSHNYELLIRMRDKNDQILPPGAFLPAAERYEKMAAIDHWVFTQAITTLANNSQLLDGVGYFSVNLSAQSISDESFLDFLVELLELNSAVTNKLCIEITETAVISNMMFAMNFISRLKGLGVRFALDDFGSGLSSFGYLKSLPVDYLKIDGLFVKGIADDPIDFAMVKSIHEVGNLMGLKTIAEFVENEAILNELRKIEVDYAQGYGIGKPSPLCLLINS